MATSTPANANAMTTNNPTMSVTIKFERLRGAGRPKPPRAEIGNGSNGIGKPTLVASDTAAAGFTLCV